MQEYGELALALALENNLHVNEDVFSNTKETSLNNLKTSNNEDLKIWKRLIKGDKLALGELYDLYIDVLFNYGMYHSKDRGYVMDCIHDLFLDLHKYRKNLSVTSNVKYYLLQSLKRKINKKYKVKDKPFENSEFQSKLDTTPKNHTDSCERQIINKEQVAHRNSSLSKAIKTLTDKQRRVLYLRFNEDRSYEEISEIMGISVETARTSIYRAIKALRKLNFYY
ncbi:RNA polymerase sigma factor [Neotamlana laminarinivorans]|uniref:Sigma-70 family RNA polymerase sigma factor n=1 Tax=Neotamlana laminarinivorans TaxID=2883124 RepID=A0A9X1I1L5_9FLAO|nr:sigma-70 family RNA polymerase sigma factor [Tamlana laminarinivorans]MCB4800123.1 sigma-70 family RNA polymerase sigma factor [Tamlana laminarinivorans]